VPLLGLGQQLGLSTEVHRSDGQSESRHAWHVGTVASCIAIAADVACFVLLGFAAGVQTQFPFSLMAVLSAVPSIGLVPWLVGRTREQFAAIILAGVIVLGAKLAGCVVARIVYGPNFGEAGYVAGDWRSAKLMISMFWILSTSLSLALLLAEYVSRGRFRAVTRRDVTR
jgi:hypothetical protein